MEVVIDGLSEIVVKTTTHVQELIALAAKNRTKQATNLNQSSSRSHLIMTVRIMSTKKGGTVIRSKLNFADLAGSEKIGKTAIKKATQLKEAQAINLSLTSLRGVID